MTSSDHRLLTTDHLLRLALAWTLVWAAGVSAHAARGDELSPKARMGQADQEKKKALRKRIRDLAKRGREGDEKAMNLFAEALKDESLPPTVRKAMAENLADMRLRKKIADLAKRAREGDKEAKDLLIEALKKAGVGSYHQRFITEGLATLGVPGIRALTKDPNGRVRAVAFAVLLSMDMTPKIEILIEALSDKDRHVRRLATREALIAYGFSSSPPEVTTAKWPDMRKLPIGTRKRLLDVLLARLDSDGCLLFAAASGAMADQRAVEPLIKLIQRFDAGKTPIRDYHGVATALGSLGKIGGKRSIEALKDFLKSREVVVQLYAAKALGEIGDRSAIAPLEALFKKSPPGSRQAAAAAGAIAKIQPKTPAPETPPSAKKPAAKPASNEAAGEGNAASPVAVRKIDKEVCVVGGIDLDGDWTASDAERQSLFGMLKQKGATVVEELTPNTDILVVGIWPSRPHRPPATTNQRVLAEYEMRLRVSKRFHDAKRRAGTHRAKVMSLPELRSLLGIKERRAVKRPARSPRKLALERLDRNLPRLILNDVRLTDALGVLREFGQIYLRPDWVELETLGVDRNTAVNLAVRDVSVGKALTLLLDQIGKGKLGFATDSSGLVLISSKNCLPVLVQGRRGMLAIQGMSEARHRALASFNRQIERLTFTARPLADALEALRDQSGTSFWIDWRELEAVGVRRTAKVSVDLRGVSAGKCLESILADAGRGKLTCRIDSNGVALISSKAGLPRLLLSGWTTWTTPSASLDAYHVTGRMLYEKIEKFSFEGAPLEQVLRSFRKYLPAELRIDWAELEAAGVSRQAKVTVQLQSVRVYRCIELVLSQHGLRCIVDKNGQLVVKRRQESVGAPVGVKPKVKPPPASAPPNRTQPTETKQVTNTAAAKLLRKADLYRDNKMNEKAAEYYRQVIKKHPGTEAAAAAEKHLEAMGPTPKPK